MEIKSIEINIKLEDEDIKTLFITEESIKKIMSCNDKLSDLIFDIINNATK